MGYVFVEPITKTVLNQFENITKTLLFKYIENFTSKNWKFQMKNLIFFIFLLKT